jgi:cell division protein FtsI/penicillin-binding protein 2
MLIPFSLTIIFTVVGFLLALVLMWGAWRHRNPGSTGDQLEADASSEFGPAATNRWLRGLRIVFACLLVAIFGFHSYWVFRADPADQFARAKRLDARNRRLAESGLKGWVLDRTGKLENALIRYRNDAGVVSREYPLGAAAVHLTGYSDFVFGAGGLEHAYREWLTEPSSTYNRLASSVPVGKDLTVTVDAVLQRRVFNRLQQVGKPSAAVILLLPQNEVLAMASYPAFDPRSITNEKAWRRMSELAESSQEISPLVNRVLSTLVTGGPAFYYRPGSTFKAFTAAAAIDSGLGNERFTCRSEGFTAPASGRPIRDFAGDGHGTIGLAEAFRNSCNQYFAQLGLKLGRQRMAEYARRLRFDFGSSRSSQRVGSFWRVANGDVGDFDFIFAPPVQRMNLSEDVTPFDVALQSIGQGFDDLSVIQMALIASALSAPDGAYVSPTFELGTERRVISQFVRPETARQMRILMQSVVESGTAAPAFAGSVRISAGGKTGTADRIVTAYDAEGYPVVARIDQDGTKHFKRVGVADSWFIGFAPADQPRIAFAILVEDGGAGSRSAAPLAVKLIEDAAQLGYLK